MGIRCSEQYLDFLEEILSAQLTINYLKTLIFTVTVFQTQPLYDPKRVSGHVCDLTDAPPSLALDLENSMESALCCFCLSAVHPTKMSAAVQFMIDCLTPGAQVSQAAL